jgi:hypothetical protein
VLIILTSISYFQGSQENADEILAENTVSPATVLTFKIEGHSLLTNNTNFYLEA